MAGAEAMTNLPAGSPASTESQAIVLFAHGSRDPQWRAPIDAVAAAIRARHAERPVRCAFLELCEPSLGTATAELVASGVGHITVFPVFFGVGKHAREDLPVLMAELKHAYPAVTFELLPAAGEHAALVSLMAEIAVSGSSN
jgi:sirohydrochlorin cobaltochelatase